MPVPTLITFPPSLDSEFSRFLLTHYGIERHEERHVIFISSAITLVRARTVRFPVLFDHTLRLNTVHKLIDHFEPLAVPERRLVPPGTDLTALRADWKLFHSDLNTATTVLAYYHLLPHRQIMVEPLSQGAPPMEVRAVERGYPVFKLLLSALLRLSPSRAETMLTTIRSCLQRVDDRLADGRRYLLGDRFTLSDMAFAIASAPIVWPDQYGGAVPALADTPPGLQAVVRECRARPAGELALRIYRDHRNAAPAASPQPAASTESRSHGLH
ncbi:glutathione S-transferase C-terminal domain-containing protein [Conexibacter woesei]|uniref:glutathione S-transferase C-terminal domain-containing protein n=1 Tax=Conexibacter woesei TaxID=191495 RepID=UPI0004089980|nr:glutathione S-transferase C-terminal domain-containing protein [Conexibacter woesei]